MKAGILKRLISNTKRNVVNIPGWRTGRKIVVFESDDWGSIRMSSKSNLSYFSKLGITTEKCHYLRNDALASAEDLERLFDILSQYKDAGGRYPTITANTIMANPDFPKIKATDYTSYHYELFTKTLTSYPKHKNSFNLWKQGMKEGLFHPQFHGREHLQVQRWLDFLENGKSETRKAFDLGVFGLSTTVTTEKRKSYMAAYDWDDCISQKFVLESILDGLSLFKSVFGYKSLSAIAPNYVWHPKVEKALSEYGVRYIQGGYVQKSPDIRDEAFTKVRHFMGQHNNFQQIYLIRNCQFEPSSNPNIDWVDRCLDDIKRAFTWNKPAIIEMHRVNFIGYINPKNRADNLEKLNQLLKKIIQKWPEVEFMTSDQLGQIIDKDEKYN